MRQELHCGGLSARWPIQPVNLFPIFYLYPFDPLYIKTYPESPTMA